MALEYSLLEVRAFSRGLPNKGYKYSNIFLKHSILKEGMMKSPFEVMALRELAQIRITKNIESEAVNF